MGVTPMYVNAGFLVRYVYAARLNHETLVMDYGNLRWRVSVRHWTALRRRRVYKGLYREHP
ncbi:MAG: hypothetical protein ACREUA_06900 [Burkholderiales bacterium]